MADSTYQAWSTGILGSLLFLLVSIIYVFRPKKPNEKNRGRAFKNYTLRIEGVPANKTFDSLRADLEALVDKSTDLRTGVTRITLHFVVPRDQSASCATATFYTCLSEGNLIQRLTRESTNHPYRFDAKFHGITPLYESPDGADVDIIAVPGLASHAVGSWKSPVSHDVWLRDYLPHDLKGIRVLLYGYDTSLLTSNSKDSIEDLGKRLLESIKAFRNDTPKERCPIVLIGHSLGGLVVKEALIHAHYRRDVPDNDMISRACYGLLFFGVPNFGLRQEQLCAIVQGKPNEGLIRDLVVDRDSEPSAFLKRISDDFSRCFKGQYQYRVVSFFERGLSPTVEVQPDGSLSKTGHKVLLVTEKSATSTGLTVVADEDNIPVSADHTELVKFHDKSQSDYNIVKGKLKTLVSLARAEVGIRFADDRSREASLLEDYCRKRPGADDCRSDLFLTDPYEDREALRRKKGDRAPLTCEWIMETPELTAWLCHDQTQGGPRHIFWLHGNPGTGKSTMSIYLTEKLSETLSRATERTFAYFFCDSANSKHRSATAIIRGWLYQLIHAHPRLIDYILLKYNERQSRIFESFDALWSILMAIGSDPMIGTIYCLLDGLDECDETSQKLLLRQLEQSFGGVDTKSNIRILITSRPFAEIRESLQMFSNKDLASFHEIAADIDRFIEKRLEGLTQRKKYTAKIREQIRVILKEKAEQTFLWIGLACSELEDIQSKDAVRFMQSMPKDLNALYGKLLDTALTRDGHNADTVWRILSFVVVSFRPMTLLELSEACRLDQEEDDEETLVHFTRDHIATCRLMVVIQDEKVLLLHQSVKDFLTSARAGEFDENKAHAEMAHRGIDLLIDQYHANKQQDTHFSLYVLQNWAAHAGMAGRKFEILTREADFFDITSPCREQWLRCLRLRQDTRPMIPDVFPILQVAGTWGIMAIVDHVSNIFALQGERTSVDFDGLDSNGATALESATRMGHIDTIDRLLDHDVAVTLRVLQAASLNGANSERASNRASSPSTDRRHDYH